MTHIRAPPWLTKTLVRSGVNRGGTARSRGPLAYRSYVGGIAFRDEVHPAERPAIVDRELFEAVQRRLTEGRNREPGQGGWSSALLTGKLFDERGHRMTPTHCRKAGQRYRYSMSRSLLDGLATGSGQVRRYPALAIEDRVVDALRARCPSAEPDRELIARAVERVEIATGVIRVRFADRDDRPPSIDIPWQPTSSRRHPEVITAPGRDGPARPMRAEARARLLGAVARGRRWLDEIMSGQVTNPDVIAHRERCTRRQVNATVSLAHLGPDIVEAAIAGRLPHGIALRDLVDPALAWSEQRRAIGIAGYRVLVRQKSLHLRPGQHCGQELLRDVARQQPVAVLLRLPDLRIASRPTVVRPARQRATW